MNENNYLQQISEQERKALAICGICKASQLATVSRDALLADIQKATEHFPQEMQVLTEHRLDEIIAESQRINNELLDRTEVEHKKTSDTDSYERVSPTLVITHRRRHKQDSVKEEQRTGFDKGHSIHNSRPLRTYISALFAILFYVDILAWLTVPLLIFMGLLPELNDMLTLVLVLLVAGALPYITYAKYTKCPVCSMPILNRRHFSRNKYAHNLPILGHVFCTSLFILFCFWFRCPACGTPQHLIRRHKHNR
jgi:hypothetical protein